ncbi:MAG: fibronectin type III domain-containing protein, partial [Muribaculaceae bacterium]|nr:fibronectin type III domain-containing protein [Muribaculaceae bacterium]
YTTLPIYYKDIPFMLNLEPKVCGVEVQLEKNIYGTDRGLNEVSLSLMNNYSDEPLKTVVPDTEEYIFKELKADTPYWIKLAWKNENGEEDYYAFGFRTKSIETNLISSSTQTSISVTSLSVNEDETFEPSEIGIIFQREKYPFIGEKLTFKNLSPKYGFDLRPYVIYNEGKYEYAGQEVTIYTKDWDCNAKATEVRSTSVELNATLTEDDPNPDEVWWTFDGNKIAGRKATIISLAPATNGKATFNIKYRNRTYSFPVEFKTRELELKTLKPKCVSNSCAIVAAETNIADVEPNVGFEWRKNDAPASLPSTEGYGVVCEGMLEGYIKNLQATSYYNVRPFYKDASGKYYYGEWITFDPSDFSYFEPTIRTYPVQDITENSATVRGYVMPGTDNITRQGFQYWKTVGNKVRGKSPAPSEITTVEATGQIMTVTLNDLEAGTDYTFRVFVETESGYVYGEEQQFTTEGVASISDINNEEINAKIVGYYNLMGVKSSKPHKGINIVVYSDGTSKKMIKH